MICNFATEQTGENTEAKKVVRQNQIQLLPVEKGLGTMQNHKAETEICEIKAKWKTQQRSENQVPSLAVMGLWFGTHL